MLAAALVIITATVSFQHDTPPQAAYADPGDFLFNINSNNPKPDTGKGPTIDGAYSKVEINSYGWVYVLHQNKGTIDKYPPADYTKSSLEYARTITGLNNPHHFDIDSVDGNLVVLNYDGAGNPQIKILDHNGGQLRTIGGAGHAHLIDPQDVAVSYSANKIYVIDKASATDSNYAQISIYNYATGAFISKFGSHGNAYANWHAAEYRYNFTVLDAIATNPDGDIIVADRTTPGSGSPDSDTSSRIMVYDQYGKWKRTVFPVDDACDPKSFFRVYDIDTDAYGNMFIGDRYRVMVLDPTGHELLSHFWGVGNPPLTDSTSQGNIYHEELNRAGDDIPVWSVAVGPHENPDGVSLDDVIIIGQIPEGSAPLNNMLVFEGLPLDYNEGAMNTFLAENPLPCAIPDSLSLLRDDDGHIIEDMIYTPKKGPVDLAFNSTGWMFVPNRVIIYPVWEQGLCVTQHDENGNVIEEWEKGWYNNGTGQTFCRDKSETVPDERIDLMYEHANTVSIFDPDGNHVKTIGSRGSPKEHTNYYFLCEVQDPDRVNKSNWKNKYCWWKPMDVTVDANDNIYVTSAISNVDILIFDPNWKFIKHIGTTSDTKATVAWGIDVGGPNNYVYSTHQGHNAISVFDPHIDDPNKLAERIYMIGVKHEKDKRFPDLEFDFRYTMDIAVDDSTGRIFVASGQNWQSKIHIFDPVIYPDTGETYYVHVKDIDFPFNTAQSLMVMNDPHPLSPNENSLFVAERTGPHGRLIVFDNDGENPQQFKFYPEDFEHIEDPRGFKTPFGIAVNPLTDQIAISMSGFDTVVALGPGSSGSSSSSNNNIGGSNDYDYLTAPTFGLPHDTRSSPESRLIDSGISLNGLALDVGSFHTEFAKQVLQTGQDNTLSTKVKTSTGGYGGLKTIEFFYGVPHIGALSQAEGSIEVHIDPYDREEFPEITDMAIRDDKHSLLLQGNTTATVQRVDCIKGDAKKGCYKIDIGFVFANAPVGEVFALQATDSRGWSTTEYFNDGFEVQGAPLIPATMSIAADLARGAGKGSTEVTQIDRKKDLWLSTADNTTLYTKNDFGFWKKLTPDKPLNRCSQDTEYDTKEWNVMTRMHCLHGAQVESEAKMAQGVFNSSAIQKELPPGSFAHEPPLTIDHRSALLHKLGWITTDDVIKRIELSGKYDHMDGQQLKDEVHQLLLLEDDGDGDADAVDIVDVANADADTRAAALVASGQSTAVIDKINSEMTSLKEQFEAHSLILAQIHSALADLSDVLTQQKQELEIYSSSESELLGAMLLQQQQQQHALLYFLPLLSAALAAVPCLFYFRRYAKAKAKTVQVMTGEQQQQKLKSYDNNNNNAKSQLQQMQQKLEEKHQKLKQELEEKHQKLQQAQHERLQQTQQRLEELQESKQKLQESEHERLQQTQQKLEELQESKQQMQQELEEKHQKLKQELEEKHQKLQQTQQEKLQQTQQRLEELQESKQKLQQELEEKHQKLQQTQQEKLQQTQQKLEELQESKQKLQESEHEKLQQTQQKLEELQESKQQMQQELEEKHQKLQQTQQEKLQQTQQKLEELQESKQKLQESEHEKLQQTQQKLEELQESNQKMQQELEEKQQEQQNTPADLGNNAEIYKKIDELLDQKKRK